ncbi:hypothetical protein [Marinomonas pollencensis]|uniref:Flagellar basal body rod FlgEFG protein n=1 Tax=Marinomonas pollencensis TaxID=491954 RepID=A0A3E0DHL0_9GAMM|nr:hypothetical protein [Marinomonas pollencensis]REG82208.1 hypothetical protein DFP81_11096 [Marinomonas pollencensis]
MQITNSPFNYAHTGLTNSQTGLNEASQKVADAATQTTSSDPSNRSGSQIQDGLIQAKESELNAKANARVINSADQAIGSLIDIRV